MPHNHKRTQSHGAMQPSEQLSHIEESRAPQGPQTAMDADWKNQASFTVYFDYKLDEHGEKIWRTQVCHDQGEGDTPPFKGLNPSLWADFMLKEAGVPSKVIAAIKKAETRPMATPKQAKADYSIEIEFHNIDINPWPVAPLTMLEIQATFQICGKVPTKIKKKDPYRIEFYIIESGTHEAVQVALEHRPIKPVDDTYEISQTFQMPRPGRYELRTFVFLPAQGIMASQAGPVFNIVQQDSTH